MFKKIALVLLCLNFLTPKPVTAEPVTIAVTAVTATVTGYFIGWWYGSSGKDKIEADNAKKDQEIKRLKDQLQRKLEKAEEDYQQCDKRRSKLWSSGKSDLCDGYMQTMQSLREQSNKLG